MNATDWISRSDAIAEPVVALYALAEPEQSSQIGLTQADARTTDLAEGWRERVGAAARAANARLDRAAAEEQEPRVREDVAILRRAVDDIVRGIEVSDAHEVPFVDVARIVFSGLRVLLDEQNPPERRELALVRLRRYAGFEEIPPLTASAEREIRERLAIPGRLPPYERQLRTALALVPVLLDGLEQMLRTAGVRDWEAPLAALRGQLDAYGTFVERELLPRARTDHRLPAEVYAFNLHRVGVDIPPAELAARAHAAFDQIAAEIRALAPRVAAAKGFAAGDYREVIRTLKREQITGGADAIVAFYRARLAEIETIVRRERLVTLPAREARIRVASLAESAELPVAHMNPPPLVGNTGQAGEFVLPLDVPPAPGGAATERSDDFTHDAVTWTLVAHEARPGHELQFDRMLSAGLSLARAVFAFNSVNVEGWALYTEAMMLPYMPPEGQLCSLLMRLHRAARAFLDPELQSGAIAPDEAQAFLEREIVYSPPFARSEIERYTFRAPGQATSYFYGYTKLVALRAETEAQLGERFSALAFHDFVVDQGLVPPDALRSAVLERFVPGVAV
ncbi:MAG TPA: DUF885 domain-containing protein [Candidatus Limnocylindria bacterium]|nr:DUF885 domain-containing protein [Candidatus Limnocylindria bacterium]